MNQNEKKPAELLDRVLSRHRSPAAEQVNAATDRVWQRMQSETVADAGEIVSNEHDIQPRWKFRWPAMSAIAWIAVCAVLLSFLISFPFSWSKAAATAESPLYRVTREETQIIQTGDRIRMNDVLRSGEGAGAVLTLADGSRVEMRAKSELLLESAEDGVRIRLNHGGIIVSAETQRSGHLYVQTKDMTVSVIGTVFLVNTEEGGSHVAVIQGEVHVQQGPSEKQLRPGEQVATNPRMESRPVSEEISWSLSAPAHLALLQQSTEIAAPRLRFDAASIRAEMPFPDGGVVSSQLPCHGVDGEFGSRRVGSANSTPAPMGRCVGRYVPLSNIVAAAYGPGVLVEGVPDWGPWPNGYYQIEATSENPAKTTQAQLRQMLQTMLSERFNLKVRREKRDFQGYALLVGRSGLKVKETVGPEEPLIRRDYKDGGGGGVRGGDAPGSRRISIAGKASSRDFAAVLSLCGVAGRLVVDAAELAGIYDFNLILNPIPVPPGMSPEEVQLRMCSPEFDPSITNALEEQLGFRLESKKVQRDVIVIEHAERPSEN